VSKRVRRITIEVDENTYKLLIEKASEEGYSLITDYIVSLIKKNLQAEQLLSFEDILRRLKPRIERMVQDSINKHMEVIENIKRQIVDLYDKVDTLTNTMEELKKSLEAKPMRKQYIRKTGIERLREEKILFESQLPQRIPRDRFFNYLEREGAIILYLEKERIAVDRDYWEEFKHKLFEEINTDDEEVIKDMLGTHGFELFKRLREESIIYYDPYKKKWLPTSRDYFK